MNINKLTNTNYSDTYSNNVWNSRYLSFYTSTRHSVTVTGYYMPSCCGFLVPYHIPYHRFNNTTQNMPHIWRSFFLFIFFTRSTINWGSKETPRNTDPWLQHITFKHHSTHYNADVPRVNMFEVCSINTVYKGKWPHFQMKVN